MKPITHIITDIEGTTTAIDFVYKTLFPYAHKHMGDYLQRYFSEPHVQAILKEAKAEALKQGYLSPLNTHQGFATLFKQWMADDKKITPLKTLQGHIWKAGYQSGALRGHIYLDAADALQRWHMEGYTLGVYSSGSVAAQKLLFRHSDYGDLTTLFSYFFDTHIGHKRDAQAYTKIAQTILSPQPPSDQPKAAAQSILFLSDVKEELDAAEAAGFETFGVSRPSESEVVAQQLGHHKTAESFSAVDQWLLSLKH